MSEFFNEIIASINETSEAAKNNELRVDIPCEDSCTALSENKAEAERFDINASLQDKVVKG